MIKNTLITVKPVCGEYHIEKSDAGGGLGNAHSQKQEIKEHYSSKRHTPEKQN